MATITQYLDCDLTTGSNDGSSPENAYQSLAAWESQNVNAPADDYVVLCRNSQGGSDASAIYIYGWAVNSITIKADDGYETDGIVGGSGFLIAPTSWVQLREPNITFIGIAFNLANIAESTCIRIISDGSTDLFLNCLMHDQAASPHVLAYGTYKNCFMVDIAAIKYADLYNCSIYSLASGVKYTKARQH